MREDSNSIVNFKSLEHTYDSVKVGLGRGGIQTLISEIQELSQNEELKGRKVRLAAIHDSESLGGAAYSKKTSPVPLPFHQPNYGITKPFDINLKNEFEEWLAKNKDKVISFIKREGEEAGKKWVEEHGDNFNKPGYLESRIPRAVFGEFLTEKLFNAVVGAKENGVDISVDFFKGEINPVVGEVSPGNYELYVKDGKLQKMDLQIVDREGYNAPQMQLGDNVEVESLYTPEPLLAVGMNPQPENPQVEGNENAFRNIYKVGRGIREIGERILEKYDEINKDSPTEQKVNITLAGIGPSGLDMIAWIDMHPELRGKVQIDIVASKHGARAPAISSNPPNYNYEISFLKDSIKTMEELEKAVAHEFEKGWNKEKEKAFLKGESTDNMERHTQAEVAAVVWPKMLKIVDEQFSNEEKAKFNSTSFTMYKQYFAFDAKETVQAYQRMKEDGIIKEITGHIDHSSPRSFQGMINSKVVPKKDPKGNDIGEHHDVSGHLYINVTGGFRLSLNNPEHDQKDHMGIQLIRAGLATPNEKGLGLRIDENWDLIGADGTGKRGLKTIGMQLAGSSGPDGIPFLMAGLGPTIDEHAPVIAGKIAARVAEIVKSRPQSVVIAGGGLAGSLVAAELSQLNKEYGIGIDVTLLDRDPKGKQTGASKGKSRITRTIIYYQGTSMLSEITANANHGMLGDGTVTPSEFLLMGNDPEHVGWAVEGLDKSSSYGKYELLSEEEIRKQYPETNPAGFVAIRESQIDPETGWGAGIMNPELEAFKAIARAKSGGVLVSHDATVVEISQKQGGGAVVKTSSGEVYEADKVVDTLGAGSKEVLKVPLPKDAKLKPTELFWFDAEEEGRDLINSLQGRSFKIRGGKEFAAKHPEFVEKYPEFKSEEKTLGLYMMPENGSLKIGMIQPIPEEDLTVEEIIAQNRKKITQDQAFVADAIAELLPGVAKYLPGIESRQADYTDVGVVVYSKDMLPSLSPLSVNSDIIQGNDFSGGGAKYMREAAKILAAHAIRRPELIPAETRKTFDMWRESLRPDMPEKWVVNGNLGAVQCSDSPPCVDINSLGADAAALYKNGYPGDAGIIEAREAAANMCNKFFNSSESMSSAIPVASENIIISSAGGSGASSLGVWHIAHLNLQQKGLKEGSYTENPEVILVTPHYQNYPLQYRMAGFDIKTVDGSRPFDKTPGELEEVNEQQILQSIRDSITPNTRALQINSPRNPDGYVYSENFLRGVLEILDENPNLRIMSDVIYKDMASVDVPTLFGLANEEQRNRIYESDALSKSASKTMDRPAWLATGPQNTKEIAPMAPKWIGRPAMPQMMQLVSLDRYLDINAPDYYEKNVEVFQGKMEYTAARLNQIEGMQHNVPKGAYYAFADLRGVNFGENCVLTPQEKERLMEDKLIELGVKVQGGSNFGQPGAIRFNSSFPNETLELLLDKVQEAAELLGVKVNKEKVNLPEIDRPDYNFQTYDIGVATPQKFKAKDIIEGQVSPVIVLGAFADVEVRAFQRALTNVIKSQGNVLNLSEEDLSAITNLNSGLPYLATVRAQQER